MIKEIVNVSVLAIGSFAVSGNVNQINHGKTSPKISHVTVVTIPLSVMKWDTRSTDSTASWPDASDPTWNLPVNVQSQFACIRYTESRNHLVDSNQQSNAQGWYQFMPYMWQYARTSIGNLPETPNQATGDQQSLVAVWYYERNQSLVPEWGPDLRICK